MISRTSKEVISTHHHRNNKNHNNGNNQHQQQIVSSHHTQHIHISSSSSHQQQQPQPSHHKFHTNLSNKSIINRTSSSSSHSNSSINSSSRKQINGSHCYQSSNNPTTYNLHHHHHHGQNNTLNINHLTLSVTPTSVSSSNGSSCSNSGSSSSSSSGSCSRQSSLSSSSAPTSPRGGRSNESDSHHHIHRHRTNTTPTHLISKSHQVIHRSSSHRYENNHNNGHHRHNSHNNHHDFNGNHHRSHHGHNDNNNYSKRSSIHSTRSQIEIENNDDITNNNVKCKSSIILRTVLQLTELGINASTIRWPNITMQSHEYIIILVNNKLKIIDTLNKKILSSKHCNASSAMMNPQNNNNINHLQLLAMRDNNIIKVMNLNNYQNIDSQQQHHQHQHDNFHVIEHTVKDDHILFWRWLDSEIIAFITTKSVYHWIPTLTHSKSKCILTLDKNCINDNNINNNKSSFVQWINYDQSKDGNYLFVQGLTQSKSTNNNNNNENDKENNNHNNNNNNNGVDGVLTLYDIHNNVLKPRMNAFGACFASLESFKNITLFCYTKKEYISNHNNESITKLYIVELFKTKTNKHDIRHDDDDEKGMNDDDDDDGKHKYHIRVERKVQFYHRNDFVVSMVQCKSVLYAVTKLGCLLIFDISSGMCLYNQKVSRDVIFLVTPFPKANGIVALGIK